MKLETSTGVYYISLFPYVTVSNGDSFYVDNVYNPEALDLPYYTFFVTENDGSYRSYYKFINLGVGMFET